MASSPKPAFIRRSAAASIPASVRSAICLPAADLRCSCPPVSHVRFPGAPRLTYEQLPSAFRPMLCPVYPGSGCGTFGFSGPKAVRSWVTGRRRLTLRSSGALAAHYAPPTLAGPRPLNSRVRRQKSLKVSLLCHCNSARLSAACLRRAFGSRSRCSSRFAPFVPATLLW